ncbi:MAG: hydrolase [Deltaproteobacteria bacterium]|nr:MAG: hydrolase [Deltaproteobacteria bacterium]
MAERFTRSHLCFLTILLAVLALLLPSCAPSHRQSPLPPQARRPEIRLGYSVQVGAFSKVENAIRLTHALQAHDIWAFYFRDPSGLYKVRFGNFPSYSLASRKALLLQQKGIIKKVFIISPKSFVRYLSDEKGKARLRERIVKTAYSFIGLPYQWGGTSPKSGFDCSGFTMAVYQLNGLNLPRSSFQQWKLGIPIPLRDMRKGDLVFFATSRGRTVSHVGIYVGGNRFIHAPGKGKRIKTDRLDNSYFRSHLVGAKKYI